MINSRGSIFKTLKHTIRELTKHAKLSPNDFRKIMIAVILNDLKEWSEYIPKDNPFVILNLLDDYIINNCFIVDRISNEDDLAYVNVNTPQTNDTWKRIWDKSSCEQSLPKKEEKSYSGWEPDPACETKIVYFIPLNEKSESITDEQYLIQTYGIHGEKLKTICDKMNVFVDRETGTAWYLNNVTCEWEQIGKEISGMTKAEVEALISEYKIHRDWVDGESGPKIELTLVKGDANNTLDLLTKEEVEAMI